MAEPQFANTYSVQQETISNIIWSASIIKIGICMCVCDSQNFVTNLSQGEPVY